MRISGDKENNNKKITTSTFTAINNKQKETQLLSCISHR